MTPVELKALATRTLLMMKLTGQRKLGEVLSLDAGHEQLASAEALTAWWTKEAGSPLSSFEVALDMAKDEKQ